MQFSQFAYIAIDLARERTIEAEAHNRYAVALGHTDRPGLARRSLARAAAGVSHASASLARRLDAAAIEPDAIGGRTTA
jgi:hypothetical protein